MCNISVVAVIGVETDGVRQNLRVAGGEVRLEDRIGVLLGIAVVKCGTESGVSRYELRTA